MADTPAEPKATVYYDGSCALCSAEIGLYSRQKGAEGVCFVDISQEGADAGADLDRTDAMKRFHVRDADGTLRSGASGFAHLWLQFDRWRWLARIAAVPGIAQLLELLYRGFLPVRPLLSRIARRLGARPVNDQG